ncbi:MAG: hypothetical protein K1W02_14870 [Muribaculaceae bacterium]|jgi:hypothetical protein
MKRKAIFGVAIVALLSVGAWFSGISAKGSSAQPFMSINEVEAISGCETEPDMKKNTGYCVRKLNSTEGTCVEQSSHDAVRCSGNI